jgi:hypothetical protein
MTGSAVPRSVVFIHGWLHATSWQPWELFRAEGYAPLAPGWQGERVTVETAGAHADDLADHGIDEVVVRDAGL